MASIINRETIYKKQLQVEKSKIPDRPEVPWDLADSQVGELRATSIVGDTRIIPNETLHKGIEGGAYKLFYFQDEEGGRNLTFGTDFKVVGSIDLLPNALTIIEVVKIDGKGVVIVKKTKETTIDIPDSMEDIEGLIDALSGKVDDSQVLTNVPVNAKFTDTIYNDSAIRSDIAGKADISHTHAYGDLTGLPTIPSTAGDIGAATEGHTHTKAEIGLGNVNNTSDANKPVSTAQQTALDGKVDNAQVLTDVPTGAVFTDTVYTPTGATGTFTDSEGVVVTVENGVVISIV